MRVWRCDKRMASDGTSPFYILAEKVPNDFWLVVEEVSAIDVDTACTSIRVGVWNNNRFLPFVSHDTCVANEMYYKVVLVRLRSPEQLAFEFIGSHKADELHGWAFGVLVMHDESYIEDGKWTGR